MKYDFVRGDLEALIESVIFDFEGEAHEKAVELIHLKAKEKIPEFKFDQDKVRVVLQNLIDNAIRYAWKDGEAVPKEDRRENRIVIRYFPEGQNVRVEVEDNGVGIPAHDQKYIFQKFFRSSNAVRRQTEGSGLGLFIVKSLLEKTGGGIGFHSTEDKGSTFWFTLPLSSKARLSAKAG